MDKIQKLLARLTEKERQQILETIIALEAGKILNSNIKKLRGHQNVYRVRAGKLRIIFLNTEDEIKILEIARRNEKTYKNF